MPEIINLIPYGKENAITKNELIRRTGKSDRAVRDMIAELRKSGEVIISSSYGKGFYRPRKCEAKAVEKFIAEQMSRAEQIRQSTNGAKKWLSGQSGQQRMDFTA